MQPGQGLTVAGVSPRVLTVQKRFRERAARSENGKREVNQLIFCARRAKYQKETPIPKTGPLISKTSRLSDGVWSILPWKFSIL